MNVLAVLSPDSMPAISAAVCALALLGFAWCFLDLARLRRRLRHERAVVGTAREEQETSMAALRHAVEGLSAQWHEVRSPAPAAPPPVRGGLNLTKRSQALRLHRRGEPPERIAGQLEIPLQEVELLLKVHEIVMRAI